MSDLGLMFGMKSSCWPTNTSIGKIHNFEMAPCYIICQSVCSSLYSSFKNTSNRTWNKGNKARSPVVSHQFVRNPRGVGGGRHGSNKNLPFFQIKLFIAGKHGSREELIILSLAERKIRKRRSDWWWMSVASLQGRRSHACPRVVVCWGGAGGHFLLASVVYVCPLAWTPVRSFLMISFTSSR